MAEKRALTVDELLAEHRDEVAGAAQWLREVIRGAMPDAAEKVWPGWHGFGYRDPVAGYALGVFPREADVFLFFEWGVLMPDPHGLLVPSGKRGRAIVVSAAGTPPADVIVEYVDLAVEAAAAGKRS